MAFGHRTYLDCAAVWRRWKMHPTWVSGIYSRFVPRKARVRRLNKFLGVFHFLWNSGFARLCGLRDLPVLSDACEPRRGLPHEEVRGRVQALPPGCDCKGAPNCAGSIDKTKAFEFALGFAPSDALEVIRQLYGLIADNLPAYKAMGPAKRYEHLAGSFGFDARVARREVKNLLGHNIGGRGFSLLSPNGWRIRLSWGNRGLCRVPPGVFSAAAC